MVIPMGSMGPPLMGPPPAELARHFKVMKYCVLTMIASMCTKFMVWCLVPEIGAMKVVVNSFNLILNTIVGIFLLRDDPLIGRVHQFLARTCCQTCDQSCGGGMNCLMTFALCNAITALMDLLLNNMIGFTIEGVRTILNPSEWPAGIYGFELSIFILATIAGYAAQTVAAVYGFLAYRRAQALGTTATPGSGSWGGGGYGGGAQYPPAREDPGAAPQREARPGPNFQPFGGSGQRLGGGA